MNCFFILDQLEDLLKSKNSEFYIIGATSKLASKFLLYYGKYKTRTIFHDEKKIPKNKSLIVFNFVGTTKRKYLHIANFEYPKNTLDILYKNNNKIFWIQFSSLSVYGHNFKKTLFINSNSKTAPNTEYGKSKLNFDLYLKNFSNNKNFKYIVLRVPRINYENKFNYIYFYLSIFFIFPKDSVINYINYKEILLTTKKILKSKYKNRIFILNNYSYICNFNVFNFFNKIRINPEFFIKFTSIGLFNSLCEYLCYKTIFKSNFKLKETIHDK